VIVLDASAAIEVLANAPTGADLRARLETEESLHAPHVIDVEVLNVLRRKLRGGEMTAERCAKAIQTFRALPIQRYPHDGLLTRIWQLRDNLSAYDAAYVALAEALDAPLVTFDSRLARSSGHRATIELLAR